MTTENGKAMLAAIERGDAAQVRALVEKEAGLAGAVVEGGDMLGWAAFYARPEIVEFLLACGVEVNWRTSRGTTPLTFAVKGAEGALVSHGVNRPKESYAECAALLRGKGAAE